MSISRFAPGGSQFDVTPLENLYIENYMASAPGEFVKAYIYGLMLCYQGDGQDQSAKDLAQALHQSDEAVRAAFAYWEQLGLVNVLSQQPLQVEYVNLKRKFLCGTQAKEPERERLFADLVQHVQGVFSGSRVLVTAEYNRINDWYTALGFDPEAIVLMIQYCIDRKGPKVSFKYIDAMAQDLSRKGITSLEDMEAHLSAADAANSGATRILTRWNLKRLPTADELALWRKWTDRWGFTEDAIGVACADMTGVANPNFKYLDTVLTSLHERGAHSAEQAGAAFELRKRARDAERAIARALGMRETSSTAAELARILEHYTSQGFSQWGVELAARMLSLEGRSTLADLKARLDKWLQEGAVGDDALMLRSERDGAAARAVRRWLTQWGHSRAPTAGELSAYERFTHEWAINADVIDYAAERSAVAERPLAMMNRLLQNWREKGVQTRQQAQALDAAMTGGAKTGPADFAERDYAGQRTYTQEDFSRMKSDVDDL